MYEAKVIADSVSPDGFRLTSFQVTIPRIVLAEFNTHRRMCLSGQTKLYFELPSKKTQKSLYKMDLASFWRKWHVGTKHTREKKGKYDLSKLLDDKVYGTRELAETLGMNGHTCVVNACRLGGLPHTRVEHPRHKHGLIQVKGSEFKEWYSNPPSVEYSLRNRLQEMNIRCLNEDTQEFTSTKVVDVWKSGQKEVFEVTFEGGYRVSVSQDHLFLTSTGWKTLLEATGMFKQKGGGVCWSDTAPLFASNGYSEYKDPEVLTRLRQEGLSAKQIAARYGVSVDQIKYRFRAHKIPLNVEAYRENLTGRTPWNKGLRYESPKLKGKSTSASVTRGEKSHFWRSGVTSERALIGQWGRQVAREVHKAHDFKCALCTSTQKLTAHHVDPVVHNKSRARDITNMMSLCQKCHVKLHARHLELELLSWKEEGKPLLDFWALEHQSKPNKLWASVGNKLRVNWVAIKSIRSLGVQETYDIEVQGPWHNFVADGVVVHNSRNSASSRAIPVEKTLARVESDPFVPTSWGKNQKGMSASEDFEEDVAADLIGIWQEASERAMSSARALMKHGVHKQIANRLLEPWLWQTIICTGSEWENYFNLRLDRNAQPEIRIPTQMMFDAMQASEPEPLGYGEWHLPLVKGVDLEQLRKEGYSSVEIAQISCGRCARVSYLTHDGKRDPKSDIAMCSDRLVPAGHMSPLEHAARPMYKDEMEMLKTPQVVPTTDTRGVVLSQVVEKFHYYCGNVEGWVQMRKLVAGEAIFTHTEK